MSIFWDERNVLDNILQETNNMKSKPGHVKIECIKTHQNKEYTLTYDDIHKLSLFQYSLAPENKIYMKIDSHVALELSPVYDDASSLPPRITPVKKTFFCHNNIFWLAVDQDGNFLQATITSKLPEIV